MFFLQNPENFKKSNSGSLRHSLRINMIAFIYVENQIYLLNTLKNKILQVKSTLTHLLNLFKLLIHVGIVREPEYSSFIPIGPPIS